MNRELFGRGWYRNAWELVEFVVNPKWCCLLGRCGYWGLWVSSRDCEIFGSDRNNLVYYLVFLF
ncbi:hypothetical protein QA612_07275 [Evansella sp. AB-P1]|uniref:hypothetical protein n=1 Tax=Evansella sp. AB-P1 TaxID=3037653 RepID=UPI0024200348|nr:hypothetical protein [Evansella sp. AB-P1]MDG5787291.1 hypothetical protein [Evansella sp. AB-P1]